MVLRYVLRYASAENSRKRKGIPDLFAQETQLPVENPSPRWKPFRSVCGSSISFSVCVCVVGESVSSYVHSTYTYTYIRIYSLCTHKKIQYVYMVRARFIVLSINACIVDIFKSQSDSCRLSFAALIDESYFSL